MGYEEIFHKAGILVEKDDFKMGVDERYVSPGIVVDNSSGGDFAPGDLVYITGFDTVTKRPQITLADADSGVSQATHVIQETIVNGEVGLATPFGRVVGTADNIFDTSGFTAVGQLLYLSVTATTTNTLTETAPSAAGQLVQAVGIVIVKSATIGEAYFFPGSGFGSHIVGVETILTADLETGLVKFKDTQLTDTNILALAATPITVVASPGAGLAIVVHSVYLHLDVGAGAYDDVAADGTLGLIYDSGADQSAGFTMESDTFIDSASDVGRFAVNGYDAVAGASLAVTPIAAKAIQLNNDGTEFTTVSNDTSTNTLSVRVWYSVVAVAAFS